MVKNDSAKRTGGCKTTTGLVQTMTAFGQDTHKLTEKRFNFYLTHLKKGKRNAETQFFVKVFEQRTVCTLPYSFLRVAKSKRPP